MFIYGYMASDHSDSERGNPLPQHGLFFYMHHPTDRIIHTTAFVKPVVEHWLEREIAQWVHHEGLIRRSIALTTELRLATQWKVVPLALFRYHQVSECILFLSIIKGSHQVPGARCSSVVRAFAHGAMGRRIDPSWGGPIELCLVPASAPRLV